MLAMWAAGTAVAAAAVAWWRIVGPGYTWLSGGVIVAIGGAAWFFEHSLVLLIGVVAGAIGVVVARRGALAAGAFGSSGVAFLLHAIGGGGGILAFTGSAALGGITAEMLLGHWYLVSPTMPRWALRRLDAAGTVGIVADGAALVVAGALVEVSGAAALAFAALAVMSVLLMVAVWYSLKEPSYPGVMAATGLSYLAVLTSLGATALGRTLLDGSGPALFGG